MNEIPPSDASAFQDEEPFRNPRFFTFNGTRYTCNLCSTRALVLAKAVSHEESSGHVERMRAIDGREVPSSDSPFRQVSPLRLVSPLPPSSPPPDWTPLHPWGQADDDDEGSMEDGGDKNIIEDIQPFTVHGPALPSDPADQVFDDWGGFLSQQKPTGMLQAASDEHVFYNSIEEAISDWDVQISSDLDEIQSDSDFEDDLLSLAGSDSYGNDGDEHLSTEAFHDIASDGVQMPDDADWWPWNDEKQCLLDVLSAFPRGCFSEAEMEITRWFATRLGVTNIPSVRTVKYRRESIRRLIGTKPQVLKSRLGNLYCKATIAQIMSHEMANPLIRKHLHFYPEDSGPSLSEVWQADRWLHEVNAAFSGPMVRFEGQDYFVEEPALAMIGTARAATPVFPIRFFKRGETFFATVHHLTPCSDRDAYLIEACDSLDCFEVPIDQFVLSYPQFLEGHKNYGLPCPANVAGVRRRTSGAATETEVSSWTHAVPNPWRDKARGRRVLAMPIWLYCDDTSGNSSKKWNKHNSFLFVLGGLPHNKVHLAYNIHFVSTSNLAPPLEMLEGITEELVHLQLNGLGAWDCELQEDVLLIPWALAFLGDNPMQSELSSHIGMQGKFFCRVCHVSKETTRGTVDAATEKARLTEFLSGGSLRTRDETITSLLEQWEFICSGVPSRIDSHATACGVKDKYMGAFIDVLGPKIAELKKNNRALRQPETTGLDELIRSIVGSVDNRDVLNPIFKILGLDPNRDTPVEILHVVLLGFVKYFWRDAVSRQNAAGKRTLKTRLSSLDVSGLGLDPLNGHTLVQYAKSLTGRDFRAIVQVAPAVLYDLVPAPAYRAWLALCRLCPLVFQNEIVDRVSYTADLTQAVDDFLFATALWNTQWFNKPKFHVLIHLVHLHIARFGPAPLMATEGFESYNYIIRLRSIQSNRHAPSVDIARSMSHMHAIRHLVSGGYIPVTHEDGSTVHKQAGIGVRQLLQDSIFVKLMVMERATATEGPPALSAALVKGDSVCAWSDTKSSSVVPRAPHQQNATDVTVYRCRSVNLANGDVARLDGFVLASKPSDSLLASDVFICRVIEILRNERTVIGLLLEVWTVFSIDESYHMPRIRPRGGTSESQVFVEAKHILCAAHTFHNCVRQQCNPTMTRAVAQERVKTGRFVNEYRHDKEPEDRLLNTAQMRSAALMYQFRWQGRDPAMSREEVISAALSARHAQLSMPAPQTPRPPTPRTPAQHSSYAPTAPNTPVRPQQASYESTAGYHSGTDDGGDLPGTPTPAPSKRRRLR